MPTDKTEAGAAAVESKAELSAEELAKVAGGFFEIKLTEVYIASREPAPPPPPPAKP